MVDLSNLTLKEENIEVADDASYVDASQFPPPLAEGIYTFIQGKPEFKATGDGALGIEMNHVVAGGEHDGEKLNFDRISDKPFERGGVRVSMAADHVRAVYAAHERPVCRSHADYATALEAAEGKSFKAEVVWEGGCNHEDTDKAVQWTDKQRVFRVKGARNFPQTNGKPTESMACPTCGKEVQARARIARRIAQ